MLALLLPSRAEAFTLFCASSTEGGTTSFLADNNETSDMRVGYRSNDGGLRFRDRGIGFQFVCPGFRRFHTFSAILGNRDDSIALVGAGGPFGPLPRFLDVSLNGGRGDDFLKGHEGADVANGGLGADDLRTLAGSDIVRGQDGNDLLDAGPEADIMRGGPGGDLLLANDGSRDLVNCGGGDDQAVVDAKDRVVRCGPVQVK